MRRLRTFVSASLFVRVFVGFYLLVCAVFLLDGCTRFDLDSRTLKAFVYAFPFLAAIPVGALSMVTEDRRIRWALLPAISAMLLILFLVGPVMLLFNRSSWTPYRVVAVDRESRNRTIEKQSLDVGALGYEDRTVIAVRPFPFVMWCTAFEGPIDASRWQEVTPEECQQLGLPRRVQGVWKRDL